MLKVLRSLASHRSAPLLLGLLSAALLAPALFSGFQLDDHFQRFRLLGLGEPAIDLFVFYDGDPDTNRAQMESGHLPWWSHPTLRHANLRYLSVLSMQLDYLLWPDSPLLMHFHSLIWLALLIGMALVLYRRCLPMWPAAIAGLLYALDDAHALPTAYLANRNALIATFFGLACLYCHARQRQDKWHRGVWLSPLCLALALSAGELAISTVAFLGSFALTLDRGTLLERVRALIPNAIVSIAWFAVHRMGGFGSEGSGVYIDPFREPIGFLQITTDRAAALLLGQWTPFPSDWASVIELGTSAAQPLRIAALITVALLALLFTGTLRRDPACRFFLLGSLVSLAPVCAVTPQNRLLFFVGFGAMGMIGCLARDLTERSAAQPAPSSRLVRTGFAALLILHLVLAPALAYFFLAMQNDAARRMEAASSSVPDQNLEGKTLVLLNPPDSIYSVMSIPMMRMNDGRERPIAVRALAHGGSAMKVLRETATTLHVTLEEGLFPDPFSRYFRSQDAPFTVGDRVNLDGLRVEVLGLDASGDPHSLRFQFSKALDDPSLLLMAWNGAVYEQWMPPAIGETQSIAEQRGLFG